MGETVTVVVPVYNAAEYLAECLDSLQAQTLPGLQVVVVLDAPTDSSAKVAREYEDDPRFRIVELAENVGPSQARNVGLREARGEFVGFVDADDLVDPAMFATLHDAAVADGADIAATGYRRVAADGTMTEVPFPHHTEELADADSIRQALIGGHSSRMLWFAVRSIFRRSMLPADPFAPDLRMGEDVVFNLQAFGAAQRVTVVDGAFYAYREVATSATTSQRHNPDLPAGLQRAYDRKMQTAARLELPPAFTADTHLYTIDNLLPRLLANALRAPDASPRDAVADVLALPMVRSAVAATSLWAPLPTGQRVILALAKLRQPRLLARFLQRTP